MVALGAVAILGYSAFWFYQANEIEKGLASHVQSLQGNTAKGFRFENQGVEKGGFPADIKVSIKNPKFTNTDPENPNTFNVDGTLSFGFDIGGRLKYQELLGQSDVTMPGNEQGEPEERLILNGEATLYNEGEGPHYKKFFNELFTPDSAQAEEFWKKFLVKGGELKLKNFTVKTQDADTGILGIKEGDITYKRNVLPDQQQRIHLSFNLKDFDIKIPSASINEIDMQNLGQYFNQKLYDKMGKSQAVFDLDATIPDWDKIQEYINNPMALIGGIFRPVDINLKNFNVTSNFGKFDGRALVNIKEDDKRNFNIKTDAEFKSDYNKEYGEALASGVNSLKQQLTNLEPENDDQKQIKDLFVNYSDQLIGLIPNFQELGAVTFTKDGNITINRNDFSYKVDIKKLDLFARQYGIRIRTKLDGQGANTNGNINVNLSNLDKLVADASNYSNRVFKLINSVSTDTKLGDITPALQNKIVAFFRKISDDPQGTGKDVNITVTLKDSEPTIGKLSYQDFLTASGSLIADINAAVNGNNQVESSRNVPEVPADNNRPMVPAGR